MTTNALPPILGAIALLAWPRRAPGADPARVVLAAADRRAALVALGVACAAELVAPGLWWLGALIGGGSGLFLRHHPPPPPRRERSRQRRRAAQHAELAASCLAAGLPLTSALILAAQAIDVVPPAAGVRQRGRERTTANPDPVAGLVRVASLIGLGADPDAAWRLVDRDAEQVALAAAARRSALSGAPMADVLREHAERLRAGERDAAARAAARAGVAMTAPLGLCFLPAFVCLGLGPVLVSLLARLTPW